MTNNIFGTDGIRAMVGVSPFTLHDLSRLGYAFARWTQYKYGRNATILLAHDTRASCAWVKAALKSGLLLGSIKLYDAQILTSPAVVQLMKYYTDIDFNCGIIISASHNMYQDNGIKVIDAQSGKLSLEDEQKIGELYANATIHNYTTLGSENIWLHAAQHYQETLKKFFKPLFLQGKKVILDCAHGAAYQLAPAIFESFGATVIAVNTQPNGININKQCGSLFPKQLQQLVVEYKADIGFAFDGDADRIIVVNKYGQLKNGDDILTLLLAHPNYAQTKTVVGTIMTNQGFEIYLHNNNRTLVRAPVGDKYVAHYLQEYSSLLGGEQSGHIIVRDYLNTGDGIFVALRLLETLFLTDNWDMITFIKFPQVIINVPVDNKKDLTLPPYAHLIEQAQLQLPQGRLIVRYSGTESLLRIMVEDLDFDRAQALGSSLSLQLQQALN